MFSDRFTSHEEIQGLLKDATYSEQDTETQLRDLRMNTATRSGSIAKEAGYLKDNFVHLMFGMVAQYGLQVWCPDVLGGSATSLYNSAHEIIAIESFQRVVTAHGYIFKGPNLRYARDTAMLTRMYRNFVFSAERTKVIKEVKTPGCVARERTNAGIYKRRIRVCSVCLTILLCYLTTLFAAWWKPYRLSGS